MSEMYDFLIVGSGLYGAVCARELTNSGYKCLVIDKRNHIGGNIYTENIEGITIHKYGAHIFHTNNKEVWDYVNNFVEFNNFINAPIANYKGKIFNLPFNMNTFYQLWGISNPNEAYEKIQTEVKKYNFLNPKNIEEQALNLVGKEIYETLIKGYSEKQWGRDAKEIPAFIIKRIPLRFTFNNNYFFDKYQGIPVGGYTKLIEKLLEGIEFKLNIDFLKNKDSYFNKAKKIIYTGPIDAYYNFKFGELEYRSLEFKTERHEISNFQGNAVVNYTDKEVPYTRILEHKHFEFGNQPITYITKEYSRKWEKGDEPYYPINDFENQKKYNLYHELSFKEKNVFFGGRLAEYKYYDMHQVIENALNFSKKFINDK